MPRLINLADQKNLWGATTSGGLEPQRSDLWLVDLTELVNGLNKQGTFEALGLAAVPKFLPQFVQSVTFPELKMKAEAFRRDSIPFNMPSWDEPMDPVKITFLMDTWPNPNQSMVVSLMQAWQAIVRAGRGDRSSLYADDALAVPLNANFRYDYTFPIRIAQLRGGFAASGHLSGEQIDQMNQQMVYRSQQDSDAQDKLQAALASGDQESAITYANMANPQGNFNFRSAEQRPLKEVPWLHVAGNWMLSNCWLGGWKMSDHTYAESKPTTVDATIYAEDLYQIPA